MFAKNKILITIVTVILMAITIVTFSSCSKKTETESKRIAVFVPGIVSGSPVYEMLVEGVSEAVINYNNEGHTIPATISIVEAGTNQAEWGNKITAVAASGNYDVIISSNPSLPDLVEPLTEQFPKIKFIILDAYLEGNKNITTVQYNQREQAYLAGVAAALVTTAPSSEMEFANSAKKIGLIAAQEYPVMNNIILPGFIEGAKSIDKDITVDFRVVGNWYDASKGAELARSLYNDGVDVILPIAGGAAQGVIATAKDLGFYITWFDDNGFSKAPGYVVSSTVLEQAQMAYEVTTKYLEDKIEFGKAYTVGIAEGYVELVQDDEIYISAVSPKIRNELSNIYDTIVSGDLLLPSN